MAFMTMQTVFCSYEPFRPSWTLIMKWKMDVKQWAWTIPRWEMWTADDINETHRKWDWGELRVANVCVRIQARHDINYMHALFTFFSMDDSRSLRMASLVTRFSSSWSPPWFTDCKRNKCVFEDNEPTYWQVEILTQPKMYSIDIQYCTNDV